MEMQKEAERRQEKLVRDNEEAKEARMAISQAYSSGSCSSSSSCTSKSTVAEKHEFHNSFRPCLI
jgi:hypothetical protein